MIAIRAAYKAGLLNYKQWWPNLVAGMIVGIVALPLAMAFAISSGVPPAQGIYTAIIAGLVVGVCGGTRVQIAGPTGAFVIILANITAKYGINGLQIATLLAGGMLILMGIAKLGNVIKYIPDPVIVGFTSGIGVIIFVGEWKDFFGLPVTLPLAAHFYQKIAALSYALPHLNITTTALALLSIALIILSPKIFKRLPGPLVAMVIVTAIQATFHYQGVATLGSAFGGIPSTLPHLQLPSLSVPAVLQLIGPAFTIALLGAIESLLSATAADGMTGNHHNSNQELIGQGLANLCTPLLGGFAATGAIARTATNVRNGGNSPLAAITHSIVLILVIVLLAPLAASVPLCALAAILFVVAYNMSDIPHFMLIIRKAPPTDVIVLLTTFTLTIFTDLVVAVNIGVILAMLFFIRRMNQTVTVDRQALTELGEEMPIDCSALLAKNIMVYSIQGPWFFGVAEKIEQAMRVTHTEPSIIIIRLKNVPFIDMTGLATMQEILHQYHRKHVKIYLCEANPILVKKITQHSILTLVEGQRIFNAFSDVVSVCSSIENG